MIYVWDPRFLVRIWSSRSDMNSMFDSLWGNVSICLLSFFGLILSGCLFLFGQGCLIFELIKDLLYLEWCSIWDVIQTSLFIPSLFLLISMIVHVQLRLMPYLYQICLWIQLLNNLKRFSTILGLLSIMVFKLEVARYVSYLTWLTPFRFLIYNDVHMLCICYLLSSNRGHVLVLWNLNLPVQCKVLLRYWLFCFIFFTT